MIKDLKQFFSGCAAVFANVGDVLGTRKQITDTDTSFDIEVRGREAIKHYYRTAQLDPNVDILYNRRELTGRTGDFYATFRHDDDLVKQSISGALSEQSKASDLSEQALALGSQGRYVEAEALYRAALAIYAQTPDGTGGKADPDYATDLNNLAGVLQAQGQYGEAEALCREALAIAQDTLGEAHPTSQAFSNNLDRLLAKRAVHSQT